MAGHPILCATCFGIDWTQPHTCSDPDGCFCFCRLDGEAERVAEVFDQAATDQATIEEQQ